MVTAATPASSGSSSERSPAWPRAVGGLLDRSLAGRERVSSRATNADVRSASAGDRVVPAPAEDAVVAPSPVHDVDARGAEQEVVTTRPVDACDNCCQRDARTRGGLESVGADRLDSATRLRPGSGVVRT